MAQDGELRVSPGLISHSAGFFTEIVKTGSAGFQPCRVDGAFRTQIDQAALAGGGEYKAEQSAESPFFKSRFSAFSRVVQ